MVNDVTGGGDDDILVQIVTPIMTMVMTLLNMNCKCSTKN